MGGKVKPIDVVVAALCLWVIAGVVLVVSGMRGCGSVDGYRATQATQSVAVEAVLAAISSATTRPAWPEGPVIGEILNHARGREILSMLAAECFDGQTFRDGWGRPMRWESAPAPDSRLGWVLVSAGAGGRFGTTDDLRSDAL